jgi:hypothetical protein
MRRRMGGTVGVEKERMLRAPEGSNSTPAYPGLRLMRRRAAG